MKPIDYSRFDETLRVQMADAGLRNFSQFKFETFLSKLIEPTYKDTWAFDVFNRKIPSGKNFEYPETYYQKTIFGSGSQDIFNDLYLSDKATSMPTVNVDYTKVTTYNIPSGHSFVIHDTDLERAATTGYDVFGDLSRAFETAHRQWTDKVVYLGLDRVGAVGLFNNPAITAASVTTTNWSTATQEQILKSINNAIQAAYDLTNQNIYPSRLLLPSDLNPIFVEPRATYSDMTLQKFIELNSLSSLRNNAPLQIEFRKQLNGIGAGGSNRMVLYTNDQAYLDFATSNPVPDNMLPTFRCKTYPVMWSIKPVHFYVKETVTYWDGL